MQEAFGIVIGVVVVLGLLAALVSALGRGKLYDQIGRGGLSLNEDASDGTRKAATPPDPALSARERDAEIRQMVDAGNARRRRRGEPEVDVEAELRRLTAPGADPALRGEVRQLVVARNARRARAGEPPLDVEAEVDRQLRELTGEAG